MSIQVFLLFFAVMYGVVFTISDRWRPFFMHHRTSQGWRRGLLSLIFFGLCPIGYFLVAFPILLRVSADSIVPMAVSAYAVAPLIAFYFIWIWIILWRPQMFYTEQERNTEPLKTSLAWLGDQPVSFVGVMIQMLLLLIAPLVCLVILG